MEEKQTIIYIIVALYRVSANSVLEGPLLNIHLNIALRQECFFFTNSFSTTDKKKYLSVRLQNNAQLTKGRNKHLEFNPPCDSERKVCQTAFCIGFQSDSVFQHFVSAVFCVKGEHNQS